MDRQIHEAAATAEVATFLQRQAKMPHRDVRLISKPLVNVLASSASTNAYVRMRGTLTRTRSGEPGARVFPRAPGPQSLPAPEYSVRDQPAANPGQPSHRRSQLVPEGRDQNGLFRPPRRSSHVAVPVARVVGWLIRLVR